VSVVSATQPNATGDAAGGRVDAVDAAHVAAFEAERQRLTGLAYRMLGSMTDAEDAVQEGWLRWHRLGADGRSAVDNPAAWLTTAVGRLALDRLKSAQHQREQYVGPWLPEPVLTSPDPADAVELAESLTVGFLTVLERLGPVERAAFLLADVFNEPYATVAAVVGRSEEACRQAASRARKRVRDERRRAVTTPGDAGRRSADTAPLLAAFLAACVEGDLDGLRRVLADDVVVVSDGGALVHAARHPVVGFDRAARLLTNLAKRLPEGVLPEVRLVNGASGMVGWRDGIAEIVLAVEVRSERIATVQIMVNPDKLRHVAG
jgi:RNA polymerase sigma-70 factor (ECF subfamily)